MFEMAGVKRRFNSDSEIHAFHKELDEVSCPICMDHPHNAVLLICSSHEKGCRSYICDTSYRHSNCLDRFKNLKDSSNITYTNLTLGPETSDVNDTHNVNGNNQSTTPVVIPEEPLLNSVQGPTGHLNLSGEEFPRAGNSEIPSQRVNFEEANVGNSSDAGLNLKCPLCRGAVVGWEVIEEARAYLNLKKRNCSRESCSFSGNYQELRRHARRVHPRTRPSEVDPSRQRAWTCLERQREYSDVVSAIRSAIPGAIVVGDYVIENADRLSIDRESRRNESDNTPWLTALIMFQMMDSNYHEPRARSRSWTRHRRPTGGVRERRRFLWADNLMGRQDRGGGNLHIFSDTGEDGSAIPRRRRRLTRSRSDRDHRS